jgi:hypothetical protein
MNDKFIPAQLWFGRADQEGRFDAALAALQRGRRKGAGLICRNRGARISNGFNTTSHSATVGSAEIAARNGESRGSKPSGFAEDEEGRFRRAFCLACASIVARVEPRGQIVELIAEDTNDALFAPSCAGTARRRRAESGATAIVAITPSGYGRVRTGRAMPLVLRDAGLPSLVLSTRQGLTSRAGLLSSGH